MKEQATAIIQLHQADNVAVVVQSLGKGDSLVVNGKTFVINKPLGIGHKVALKDIMENEPIVKYGIAIGKATEPISMGMHVHTHNMASNYTPTYTLE